MKNVVICCDGTLAKIAERSQNTNVVRLYERLVDNTAQATYYDSGIGTYGRVGSGIQRSWQTVQEAAWGAGITRKIETAYRYLMDTYDHGDRVYLFGYSRGAHTVRLLAQMLDRCGLLPRGSQHLIPHATDIFRMEESERSDHLAREFRYVMSRDCPVHFVGVWDTVASVGFGPMRRYFRNQPLTPNIRYGYHAMAIDERRKQFRPARWREERLVTGQTVQQVWFAGYHADIGGQAGADRAVSDKPLIWMLRRGREQDLLLRPNWEGHLDCEGIGALRPSDRYIWRLPTFTEGRQLRSDDWVHQSVIDRIEALPEYDPGLPEGYRVVQ